MSDETEKDGILSDFTKLCVPGLSREYAKALADDANFTTSEWLEVYDHCRSGWFGGRCFNMQVIAMKKAIAVAETLADWIAIASWKWKGKHRRLAFDKILQYDTTEEDIELFFSSQSIRLWYVGWYLSGRIEYKKKNLTE